MRVQCIARCRQLMPPRANPASLPPFLCFHRLPLLVLSPHHRRPFAASVLLILAWPQVSFANFAPPPSTTARFSTHVLSNRVAGAHRSPPARLFNVAVTDDCSVIGSCEKYRVDWISSGLMIEFSLSE